MTPIPSSLGHPSSDFPSGSAPDSPFRLLGELIRENAGRMNETATGLRALVVYAAEYARLHGAALPDFLGALESTISLHTSELDPAARERLRFAILHWGRLAHADADDPRTSATAAYES